MIKIWFFGTPALAKKVLEDIYNSWKIEISFVVSSPDKPVWRGLNLSPSPVKEFAVDKNIPIFTPEKIRWNNVFLDEIRKFQADYFVVIAYGKILPQELLDIPNKMSINIHGSILPKYRWASPIQSSLIAGDILTWVTIMKMSSGMDEWDIIDILEIPIDKFETSGSLFDKFAQVSWKFLVDTLIKLDNKELWLISQDNTLATYCQKIEKEDWLANFSQSSETLFNLWKWLTPWPGLYSYFNWKKIVFEKLKDLSSFVIPAEAETCLPAGKVYKNNKFQIWEVVKIWNNIWIVCWDWKILVLDTVKLEWKKSAEIWDFINWYKDFIGYKFK